MAYGVKCPKCGLMQMPKSTCKSCGAALEAPPEAPPRPPSKVSPRVPPRIPPKAPVGIPPELPVNVPIEVQLEEQPRRDPLEDRTARTAITAPSRCSECGLVFREDELIRFGDSLVCAGCKPLFVQRLREGVASVGEMIYAGFWIRFIAKVIDGILVGIAGFLLLRSVGSLVGGTESANFVSVLPSIFSLAYTIYFLGAYGATPGKMIFGLRVVRPDGEKISYGRACGRFFAEILSYIIFFIGYIIAAFDDEKRALHDRICDTRVVKKA